MMPDGAGLDKMREPAQDEGNPALQDGGGVMISKIRKLWTILNNEFDIEVIKKFLKFVNICSSTYRNIKNEVNIETLDGYLTNAIYEFTQNFDFEDLKISDYKIEDKEKEFVVRIYLSGNGIEVVSPWIVKYKIPGKKNVYETQTVLLTEFNKTLEIDFGYAYEKENNVYTVNKIMICINKDFLQKKVNELINLLLKMVSLFKTQVVLSKLF